VNVFLGFWTKILIEIERQMMSLSVDVIPSSKAEKGKAPDDETCGIKKRIGRLVGSAKPRARGPEDKDRAAPEIIFGNKPKLTAIAAIRMIVTKGKV
jgi:hypothetical protein